MEGLGYWFFLAVMYLLSAFFKKRKQQATRQQGEQEKLGSQTQESQNPFKSDFLKDLFGDIKEFGQEHDVEIQEEYFDNKELDEKQISMAKEDQTSKDHDHVVFEDLSNPEPEPIHKEYQYWKTHPVKKHQFDLSFDSYDELKRAIIMKEILDKPRAQRRSIR
ncbi:MAG: hypothetical protein OSB64_02190 [Candidatus Marinimicrobia bacterium]|jgi:hypothetical protein|nr:hypothetical protein [Candidatus Neomarinimicrobiota bacterium]|tara:strand:+ start:42 stop:530 length:489 start_codon:yes stop_codon:yes gene_type:complete